MLRQCRFQWFDPARVFDLFPEIIAALNIFSLAFCVFLFVKVCDKSCVLAVLSTCPPLCSEHQQMIVGTRVSICRLTIAGQVCAVQHRLGHHREPRK